MSGRNLHNPDHVDAAAIDLSSSEAPALLSPSFQMQDCYPAVSANGSSFYLMKGLPPLPGMPLEQEGEYNHFRESILPQIQKGFLDSLQPSKTARQGLVEINGQNVLVSPSQRRPFPLRREQIADALFLLSIKGWGPDEWEIHPAFFSDCVVDQLPNAIDADPVEWARTVIRVSSAALEERNTDRGHWHFDYAAVEHLAGLICNPHPESLAEPRHYSINGAGPLLDAVREITDGTLLPEAVIFVLDNQRDLDRRLIQGKQLKQFLKKLPALLDNGLVIDRVTEVVEDLRAKGFSARESVEHAAFIAKRVYTVEPAPPWWMKENYDMRPIMGAPRPDRTDLAEEKELARTAGYLFPYARDLYCRRWHRLSALKGLSPKKALGFLCDVTDRTGVGSLNRAGNIVDLACEMLERVPVSEQLQWLERFEAKVIGKRYGGPNPLHAVSDEHQTVPVIGLSYFITQVLGDEQESSGSEYEADWRDLAAVGDALQARHQGLLALPASEEQQATPRLYTAIVPAEDVTSAPVDPLLGWLMFAEQGDRYFRYSNNCFDQAFYWEHCARFMPDPFRPPEDFLTVIDQIKYKSRWGGSFDRAGEGRAIANFLELASDGLLDLEGAQEVLEWVGRTPSNQEMQRAREHPDYVPPRRERLWAYSVYGGDREPDTLIDFWTNQRYGVFLKFVDIMQARGAGKTLPRIDSGALITGLDMLCDVSPPPYRERDETCLIKDRGLDLLIDALANHEGNQSLVSEYLELAKELIRIETVGTKVIEQIRDAADARTFSFAELVTRYEDCYRSLTEADTHGMLDHEKLRTGLWDWCLQAVHKLFSVRMLATWEGYQPKTELPEAVRQANQFVLASGTAAAFSARAYTEIPQLPPLVNSENSGDRQLNPSDEIHEDGSLVSRLGAAAGPISIATAQSLDAFHDQGSVVQVQLKEAILQSRRACFGFIPVGAKCHVLSEIDPELVDFIRKVTRLSTNQFHLQHANTTLVLPPLASWQEMKYLVNFLRYAGVLQHDLPELQACIEGRIHPQLCAVLGASVMLSTTEMPDLQVESFKTSHDSQVAFRMMTYDAGGRRSPFPFSSIDPDSRDRTDILCRVDVDDFEVYQMLGTTLQRGQEGLGGPFAELAQPYCERFAALLESYGFGDVLLASWVNERDSRNPEASDVGERHFREAVEPCKIAWRETDICKDVRALLDWLRGEIRSRQKEMLLPGNYEDEKRQLFTI